MNSSHSTVNDNAPRNDDHSSLRDVVQAAEDLLRARASETSREYRRVRDTLAEKLHAAKAHIADEAGELAWRAEGAALHGDRFVRSRAWTAIGIGAGVGFVVGYLLRRGVRGQRR